MSTFQAWGVEFKIKAWCFLAPGVGLKFQVFFFKGSFLGPHEVYQKPVSGLGCRVSGSGFSLGSRVVHQGSLVNGS